MKRVSPESIKTPRPDNSKQGLKKDSSWIFKSIFILGISGTVLCMLVLAGVFWHFSKGLPQIVNVSDYRPVGVTRVLDMKDGQEIGEFYRERRYLIPYDKIPENVVRAFISAEDDRFFEHAGINIVSIVRASIANFKAGHVVQGGSTITQQVAKSLLQIPGRSIDRKIKEAILASRIERNLTKQQILYLYLNQIYLGHGAYGVQAASKVYFNKDVSEISIAEAALLAGMPQAPGVYSPLISPKRAKERQQYVLRRMLENKYITQNQMSEAASLPLRIFRDENPKAKPSSYYVEYVRKYLIEKYGEKAIYDDGLTVLVPSPPALTAVADKSLKDGLLAVDKRIGYRGPIQHLASTEAIERYLEEQRIKLIDRKIRFQLFLPDGRMDPIEAMHFEGIRSDADLLNPGELYPAVVTGFDNRKKTAQLMIGAIRGELELQNMRWARPARDDKKPQAVRLEPTLPSRTFQKGDVILVSLLSKTPQGEVSVALEQEPIVQGALFSMDVRTGDVLAMIGGFDFEKSEFNRATQAIRQPGSAFKPLIYGAALEKGYTPASMIIDSPIVFRDSEGTSTWKPVNFEEKFYGDTTFRQALIHSRNIPTIKIVQGITVPFLIQYSKRLGMNAQYTPDLSIALGSSSTTLVELTKIYALYPRLGRRVIPIFIGKVMDRDGRVLEDSTNASAANLKEPTTAVVSSQAQALPTAAPSDTPGVKGAYPPAEDQDQLLDPRNAYLMTHLMKEVVAYGTGHQAKSLGRPTAGKTGTTNDSMDAWFMGFTSQVVTGVWVGFDSQKSIGYNETGARVALPVWLNFMKEAVKGYPEADFKVPPGIVFANIDAATGKLAPNASSGILEAFLEGTQPTSSVKGGSSTDSDTDFFKEDRD